MIRITSIKRCRPIEYDKVYLIVRSIASLERSKSGILQHAEQIADLSPSKSLFYQYLDWQRSSCWNQKTFDDIYKPTFLNELTANPNAQSWLEKLRCEDEAGLKIALLCFCPDENLCHRKIVGDILREKGCNVTFDCDTKQGVK